MPEGATLAPLAVNKPHCKIVPGRASVAIVQHAWVGWRRKSQCMAIASLIFWNFFSFLSAVITAIVFGHIAQSQIKRSTGRLGGGLGDRGAGDGVSSESL